MATHHPRHRGTGHSPTQFLAPAYCDQTAGWMKRPLGTERDAWVPYGGCVYGSIPGIPESSTTADITTGFSWFPTWLFYQLISPRGLLRSNPAPYRQYQRTRTKGHIVLDGNPAPPAKGAQQPLPSFRPNLSYCWARYCKRDRTYCCGYSGNILLNI